MAIVVIIFACNLWGLFEIKIPSTITKIAKNTAISQKLLANFFQGVLATLLATPCSAPFLGSAIAFSLSRGATEILLVFSTMGIGLSIPYLTFAFFPKLSLYLPKPGIWIIYLKKLLGLSLLATSFWILSILASVASSLIASLVGLSLIAIIFLICLNFHFPGKKVIYLSSCISIALVAMVVPYQLLDRGLMHQEPIWNEGTTINWQKLDVEEIKSMVSLGRVVFVDVTADWCITCKVNKVIVLNRDPTLTKLRGNEVIKMQADWTLPSAEIANYLASFQRYGIPFNAVYGPAAPDGIALPELLRSQSVLDAINLAKVTKP